MANFNNIAVEATQQDMRDREDEGLAAGYDGVCKEARDLERGEGAWLRWLATFSPFERGYIYGRITRLYEGGK